LEAADRIYLQTAMDPTLMSVFHYAPLPTTLKSPANNLSLSTSSFVPAYEGELLIIAECQGKERLLDLLTHAGIEPSQILVRHCEALPTWSQIEARYGTEPVVYGQETCAKYRQTVQQEGRKPQPKVAGLFNSGTGLLLSSFQRNLQFREHPEEQLVPIGQYVAPAEHWLSRNNSKSDATQDAGALSNNS